MIEQDISDLKGQIATLTNAVNKINRPERWLTSGRMCRRAACNKEHGLYQDTQRKDICNTKTWRAAHTNVAVL